MQKRIQIFGVPYWLGVYQEEPHEWHAIGDVRGHPIIVADNSEQGAIEGWRKQAEAYLSEVPVDAQFSRNGTNVPRTLNPRQRR